MALGLAGLVLLVATLQALLRRRWISGTVRLLAAALILALAVVCGATLVATQGYRALVREEVAAVVEARRLDDGAFRTTFRFPDGREEAYVLRGDELYVDARIVKWHPWVNVLGLHTGYELDRVAGRYRDIVDERTRPRTVHALTPERPLDVFELARRFPVLRPLVDAEYGSASFTPLADGGAWELRVSTTGLLFRGVAPAP